MTGIKKKPRIAVISPFLDRQHGTERCVVEQLQGLADDFEFHVYSARIEGLDLDKIVWHRIPSIAGPHAARYLWFFFANHIARWVDRNFRGATYDLVYSPGINCLDAQLIAVHIVFAEFRQRVGETLRFRRNPRSFWPRLLHRKVFYRLIISLERRIYKRRDLPLVAVSNKVRDDLRRFYGREQNLFVVYNGIDAKKFSPAVRQSLRANARDTLGYSSSDFVMLLIGNDWNKKGLPCLLEAAGRLQQPRLKILVAGSDDRSPFQSLLEQLSLASSVQFVSPRPDTEFFYAAADAYTGPSMEDAFGIPPLEAMACALPVIVSRQSGISELVTHGEDGYIVENPQRPEELVTLIAKLYENTELGQRLGRKAAETALRYTWDRNVRELRGILLQTLAKTNLVEASSLQQDA